LGEGGMGAVYKAKDREVGHLVALKVIRPELANQQDILQRFKQELILARQITHKNVVRIFDLGQAEGVKFITMEFVEGRDLHSLLRAGRRFTLGEKVRIIQQVCRALEVAHAEGVVHCDLKPHNIMVEEGGRVVVMDFGIARSLDVPAVTPVTAVRFILAKLSWPVRSTSAPGRSSPSTRKHTFGPCTFHFNRLAMSLKASGSSGTTSTCVRRLRGKACTASRFAPASCSGASM